MKKARLTVRLTAAMLTLSLLTIPAIAADSPASAVRVNSYKGNTLAVGERSGLMIGPSGTEYTVTSSDPDTVAVEQITGFWVAVAKSEGTANITAANRAGESGTLTLTVGSGAQHPPVGTAPAPRRNRMYGRNWYGLSIRPARPTAWRSFRSARP